MVQACWKLCAESVTDFVRKYQRDVFYSTGWNVVLLQIGFTALILLIVFVALSVLYDDVILRLIAGLSDTLTRGTPPELDSVSIASDLEYTKNKYLLFAATGVLVLATIFGWLITRLALTPTNEALQNQKQFVGNIAHELRTPLSIIKTNTEVTLFNEGLDQDTREMLRSNIEELDRISGIINNLLSMNRLLHPEKIEFTNVDLGLITDRVIGTLAELAERKQIEVVVQKSEYRIAWGNPSGVEQIIMNVVKNALNYCNKGGKVTVSVEPTFEGHMEVKVEDNGPGIDEHDLQKIFEPFYRADRARNRQGGGGSGLGLTIVGELIKMHKGRIGIRSTVGQGTTVFITLPGGRVMRTGPVKQEPAGEIAMDFSGKNPGSSGTSSTVHK